MGEIDTTILHSKEIEGLLEQRLGAVGRGLHEKASSVEHKLPPELVKKLRYIATIRNKVVHEAGYRIDNYENFISSCEEAMVLLRSIGIHHSTVSFEDGIDFEKSVQSILSWSRPASILFAIFGGSIAWYDFGLGAGIVAALVGAVVGFQFPRLVVYQLPRTLGIPHSGIPFEEKVQQFVLSWSRPASILFAILGGSMAWYSIGLGAGIVAALVGAVVGFLLLSKGAVEFYISAFVGVVHISLFILLLLAIFAAAYGATKGLSAIWSFGKIAP